MTRILLLALACILAAEGSFGSLAYHFGLPGYGDHLAAVTIAWLLSPFLSGARY